MAWEIIVRPEKSWVGLVNNIGSESIILVINALMVKVSMPNTGEEELENLGLAVVALMIMCLIWNFGCWLLYIGIGVYNRIKQCRNPPPETQSKNMDKYIPPGKEMDEKKDGKKDEKENDFKGQSTLNIVEGSMVFEKERSLEPMVSVISDLSPQKEPMAPDLSSENNSQKKVTVIHPAAFFKEIPPPAKVGTAKSGHGTPEEKMEEKPMNTLP